MGDGCVKLLLDTHALIWSQESPELLGDVARGVMADADTRLYVSPVSSLEIARLAWGGRLTVAGHVRTWVCEAMAALLAETIALSHEIAAGAYELPGEFHRDPADRVLVASARVHDLTVLTADDRILAYRHVLTKDARL